uniref:Uncharacterized protein n=1 Tax=Glossina pallidipes TaxID=7398 RepID=A0A1A9ZZU7_GLOPL
MFQQNNCLLAQLIRSNVLINGNSEDTAVNAQQKKYPFPEPIVFNKKKVLLQKERVPMLHRKLVRIRKAEESQVKRLPTASTKRLLESVLEVNLKDRKCPSLEGTLEDVGARKPFTKEESDSRNELAHSSSVCGKSVTKQQATVTLCIGKVPTCTVDTSGSASGVLPTALAKKPDGSTHEADYKVAPNPIDRLQKVCRFSLLFLALFQTAVLKR